MVEPSIDFGSCAVCGRTILRGERTTAYVSGDRQRAAVCALCKPRAEASGWIPAALAGELVEAPPRRRRPRIRLRELLPRRAEREHAEERRPEHVAEPEPEPAPEPPGPLEVFNASHEARKVSGLVRSLGEPRVTLRESGGAHVVTVAWELSWYQWRIDDGEVRQVAHGDEIAELASEDREWNASAGEDGSLRLDER